jgi:hypothetical protein
LQVDDSDEEEDDSSEEESDDEDDEGPIRQPQFGYDPMAQFNQQLADSLAAGM